MILEDADDYEAEYEAALARGIAVSGEDKLYFARGRMNWLAECLRSLRIAPKGAMDFGCGTGSTAPFFRDLLNIESLVGVDVSAACVKAASSNESRREMGRFSLTSEYEPIGEFDLAFSSGVFHHIPPPDRPRSIKYIYRCLKPGGIFALWENNPWNPGARLVMSRIPFDRDAVMLTPYEARGLLRASGFSILRTDFLFIFPRMLRSLRRLERPLARFPLGAQYQVLCRKEC